MQKLFSFLCALTIVLSANAVPVKQVNLEKKTAAKEFFGAKKLNVNNLQAARQHKVAQAKKDVTFDFTIDELTTTSATITITPSDDDAMFYWDVAPKADADAMTDAQIAAAIKSSMDEFIQMYAEYGITLPYSQFLSTGEDTYTYDELTPGTEYVAFAFEMDNNGALVGTAARYVFSTPDIVVSGDTLVVNIDGLKFIDAIEDEGWWQLAGYNADSSYYVTLSNSTVVTEAVGTYDYADMDPDYTFFYIEDTKVVFASGTIILSQNANGTMHADAELLDTNGDVYVLHLNSKLATVSENVITLSYSAANHSIHATTTNSDPFFFALETQAEYDTYNDDLAPETIAAEVGYMVSYFAQYGALSYYTFTGAQTFDVLEFLGDDAEDGDYIAFAAPVDGDDVNGQIVYLQFHFDAPQGIENVELTDDNKTRKILMDGMLYIIRDERIYNATGQEVR